MDFSTGLVVSPVIWLWLAAFFCAAALNRMTRPVKKAHDPVTASNRKWVMVCVYLSAMLLAGICALFVPGPRKILDIRYVYLFAVSVCLFFLALRFKKSFGIPFVFLFILLFIMIFLFLQVIIAYTGEIEIAKVMVLSAGNDEMKLEIIREGKPNDLLAMRGSHFAPVVKVVIFDDLLVFFGAKTWYRFEGIVSFRKEAGNPLLVPEDIHLFKRPDGISESLYEFVEYNDGKIPGIKSPQIEVIQKRARELELYSVRVQNDGGVEIIISY
jgi:hypothetical protein